MRKVLFLLGQLTDNDVEWIIAHGQKRRVPGGEVLIHENRPLDALFLLLDGTLEVTGTGVGGGPAVRLGCGEVVGEVSFVDSRPPVATVKAAGDAVVLAIPRDQLRTKLDRDLAFAGRFYRAVAMFLAHRLRNTGRRVGKDQPLQADQEYDDELSTEVLDSLAQAGSRFDRVLQRLLAG